MFIRKQSFIKAVGCVLLTIGLVAGMVPKHLAFANDADSNSIADETTALTDEDEPNLMEGNESASAESNDDDGWEITSLYMENRPGLPCAYEGEPLDWSKARVEISYANYKTEWTTDFEVENKDHLTDKKGTEWVYYTVKNPHSPADNPQYHTSRFQLCTWWHDYYVTKVEVTKNPDKIHYKKGEIFDLTGMEITRYWSNGTTTVEKHLSPAAFHIFAHYYDENKKLITDYAFDSDAGILELVGEAWQYDPEFKSRGYGHPADRDYNYVRLFTFKIEVEPDPIPEPEPTPVEPQPSPIIPVTDGGDNSPVFIDALPKTGDNIGLYAGVLAMAGAFYLAAFKASRHRKQGSRHVAKHCKNVNLREI